MMPDVNTEAAPAATGQPWPVITLPEVALSGLPVRELATIYEALTQASDALGSVLCQPRCYASGRETAYSAAGEVIVALDEEIALVRQQLVDHVESLSWESLSAQDAEERAWLLLHFEVNCRGSLAHVQSLAVGLGTQVAVLKVASCFKGASQIRGLGRG